MWIRSQNLYVIVNCEIFFVKQYEKEKFYVNGDRMVETFYWVNILQRKKL